MDRQEGLIFRDARSAADLSAGEAVWWHRQEFAVWSVGRDRQGWALWGHMGEDGAADMKQIWLGSVKRLHRPYDIVLDLRPLESVSKGAFELIREYALAPKPGLRRHAILVGDAQPGTVQLGLYALAPPSYEWRSFRDANEAGQWLGWANAQEIFASVEERLGSRPPAVVTALRRFLAAELQAGHLPVAARAAGPLGVSLRAMQRALADAGTSFSQLLDQARVDRACALLSEPSGKLEAIARAVGFADTKGLVRLFRRIKGETPAEFRAKLR